MPSTAPQSPALPFRPGPRRYLPGKGRWIFLALALAVVVLKLLAIFHFRADSDETQHTHVAWAWTTGQLPYRDVFDNHMPLFHMAFAPLVQALGERADILAPLRLAMLPFYFLCLWAVFRLAEILISPRAAPWAALCAAACPWFFYVSTEFRPDLLWAAFFLFSLLVAVSGPFGVKRAFAFGFLFGMAFAVSIKTIALIAGLTVATAIALLFHLRQLPPPRALAARALAIGLGAALVPGLLVFFFYRQGAFWIMEYCVLQHNMMPGLKRWGQISSHRWIFPAALPFLAAYAWLISAQARGTALGLRRVLVLLFPCAFYFLLLSYWPDITRQDYLPYVPLLPLAAAPLLMWIRGCSPHAGLERAFWTWLLPLFVFAELFCVWRLSNLRGNRFDVMTHRIQDVLTLTHPGDCVMDAKGDYIFRPRPIYWALETVTKARIEAGTINDELPEKLAATGTKICYLFCGHSRTRAATFIISNYLPFDPMVTEIGVAGREIPADGGGFEVAIPEIYAVVSEQGAATGDLDGAPYTAPVFLAAGHHEFHRATGQGRLAILLADADAHGFHPLFADLDRTRALLIPPPKTGRK